MLDRKSRFIPCKRFQSPTSPCVCNQVGLEFVQGSTKQTTPHFEEIVGLECRRGPKDPSYLGLMSLKSGEKFFQIAPPIGHKPRRQLVELQHPNRQQLSDRRSFVISSPLRWRSSVFVRLTCGPWMLFCWPSESADASLVLSGVERGRFGVGKWFW